MRDAAREPPDRLHLLRLPELLLEQLVLRDVLHHRQDELRPLPGVAHDRDVDAAPALAAVLRDETVLRLELVLLSSNSSVRLDPLELVARVADHALERGVRRDDLPAEIADDHADRRRLENRPEPLLAVARAPEQADRAVRDDERRDDRRHEPDVRSHTIASTTPRPASTMSLERLSAEKRPLSANETPRARRSIGASRTWFTRTRSAPAATPAAAARVSVPRNPLGAPRSATAQAASAAEREIEDVERLDVRRVALLAATRARAGRRPSARRAPAEAGARPR